MTNTLRIATRQSPLALWQAHTVKAALLSHYPDLTIELVAMTTQGDRLLDSPLAKIGGKGLFLKELEQALIEQRADLAVHSMKDVPIELTHGLKIAAILARGEARDAFVSGSGTPFAQLAAGSVIGTSSLRRQSQLAAHRPDLIFKNLRGNVGTRLQKLAAGDYDGIVLAGAGLQRLGLTEQITEYFPTDLSLPAVGQGAIGIEIRAEDHRLQQLLTPLQHSETDYCVSAERAMNRYLQGGCQVPIAGHACYHDGLLTLEGRVATLDGTTILVARDSAAAYNATQLGETVAQQLLDQGAAAILQLLYT